MPLEGQWQRQNTPLRSGSPRERRTLVAIAVVLAIGLAVILYFTVFESTTAKAGCVDVTVPSTMGAGNIHSCGRAAQRLCDSQYGRSERDPFARAAHRSCRKAGYRAP
jgi:hypothetical protein